MNCIVCGREFDERAYQLVVPGQPGSFDSFECAARARGLPWLGPSGRSGVGGPPFERPAAAAALPSRETAGGAELARVRTRTALAGAAALAVAVAATSAYLWLRDGDTRAEARAGETARVVDSAADRAQVPKGDEDGAASGDAPESRSVRREEAQVERPGGRRAARDAARLVAPADDPAPSGGDARPDGDPAPRSAPLSPPPRQSPPRPSPTVLPPRPVSPPARPPAPVTVPAPAAVTRPGWGYGDKKHVHSGPPGAGAASAKAAKKPRQPGQRRR